MYYLCVAWLPGMMCTNVYSSQNKRTEQRNTSNRVLLGEQMNSMGSLTGEDSKAVIPNSSTSAGENSWDCIQRFLTNLQAPLQRSFSSSKCSLLIQHQGGALRISQLSVSYQLPFSLYIQLLFIKKYNYLPLYVTYGQLPTFFKHLFIICQREGAQVPQSRCGGQRATCKS